MYKLVTIEGKITVKPQMTLEEMRAFVSGPIEIHGNVICNENGLLLNLERNQYIPQFVGNIIIQEA